MLRKQKKKKTTLEELVKTRKGSVIPVEAYTTIFSPTTSTEMPVILKAELLLILFFRHLNQVRIDEVKKSSGAASSS